MYILKFKTLIDRIFLLYYQRATKLSATG